MKSLTRMIGICMTIIATMTLACTPSIYADTSMVCPLGQKVISDSCQSYTSVSDMRGFANAIYDSLGDFARDQRIIPPAKGSMYFITQENAQSSPCALSPNEPYVACYYAGKLYIGSMMLYTNYMRTGPLAPIAIIAHEYGHYLQNPSENETNASVSAVADENQADCVSGAYIAWLGTKQQVKQSSLISLLGMIWDHGSNPYMEPYKTHGTPYERTMAFTTGFDGGLHACDAIGNTTVSS